MRIREEAEGMLHKFNYLCGIFFYLYFYTRKKRHECARFRIFFVPLRQHVNFYHS